MGKRGSRKLRDGFQFRIQTKGKKPGLYFEHIFSSKDYSRKLSDSEVAEIRDFLGRYLNKNEAIKELCTSGRAKAHGIVRALNRIESIFSEIEE